MKKNLKKELISWGIVVAVAIILAFLINRFIIYKATPVSESMEDTIKVHDKVITLRTAYLFSKPKRGDILVFKFPDDESEIYIKRIIGLPGQTVEGKGGLVYIDGKPLSEDYVTEALDSDFGPYKVPKNSYFMMGDNRGNSIDSRYWDDKFVSKSQIIGKALFKYPGFKWLN